MALAWGVFILTVKESVKENVPVDTESGSHKVLILLTFNWCVVHVCSTELLLSRTISLYVEEANKLEFLQLIFYIPASLILYNATRPEIRNIFKK